MAGCLTDLASDYRDHPTYQILERVFGEHFTAAETDIRAKAGKEISPSSMQSPDDAEASYRRKGERRYKGYVTNLSETCDPANPFQLVTSVQTAPNITEDVTMLVQALPELKERTGVDTMYSDAGYCSPEADEVLRQQGVEQVPTALKGAQQDPEALHLEDFRFLENSHGEVIDITCPNGQTVPVEPGQKQGRCTAHFEADQCAACPFKEHCPTHVRKKDGGRTLKFTDKQADIAQRRQRCAAYRKEGRNLRAAVESTIGAIKRPFAEDQLPVRGLFRVGMMMIGSAAMVNVRRIQRHLAVKVRPIGPEWAASGAKGAKGAAISLLSAVLGHHFLPPRWRSLSCQAA